MAQIIISGLISFSNGSDRVTGSQDVLGKDPAFTTEVSPGDLIKLPTDSSEHLMTVKSIEDDFHLTLTRPYTGDTGSSDYTAIQKNEIKEFLNKKIPQMYRDEISEEDLNTVTNVISSSYLDLVSKINDMKFLYDIDNSEEALLSYIGYLVGFQFDNSIGQVSSFLQQPILKRNQVSNAVAWQKLKGSVFGIQQYLKTLAIQATIKELWYDSTFRNLLDSQKVLNYVSELWHKDIASNSIQLFQGNNGIDPSNINQIVKTVIDGNLVYTPVENGTIRVEIWQQQLVPIIGVSQFTDGSILVNGTLTSYTTQVQPGYKIKLNSESNYYIVATVDSDVRLTLTEVHKGSGTGATSVVSPAKVLKTRILQDAQNNFVYDPSTPNTIQVNLGKAKVKGSKQELFSIVASVNDILRIKVNGGTEQIVNMPLSIQQSAGVIANAINNQITGITATGEDGYLVLTSQDNSIYSQFEIIADTRSAASTLGIPLGVYAAETATGFDTTHSEYLTVELLLPEDFSQLIGEIKVDYQYADFVAPPSIVDNQYGTGARSNWFDIELQATNNSFILLADDVNNVINKIKTDVKPFHALLRTIKYLSGFSDIWQFQPDQPSFFIPWREYTRQYPNYRFNERMRFGYASCTCQCCLLYDNCVKKQYDGAINYNWIAGIYYDTETCYPRDLIVVYNRYIQHYGSSSSPTNSLTGTLTFTQGSKNITAVGGAFLTELTPGISFLKYPGSNLWYRVATITNNDLLVLEQPFAGTTNTTTNVPALDPFVKTQYAYTINYIADTIVQKNEPNRLIVYYDGRRYYDQQKNDYCIFHYDLGEFAKTIGTADENFTITSLDNKLKIQPLGVKEISGYSDWTNGSISITGTNTKYSTELTLGEEIKPTTLGISWYTVSNILDDTHLEVSVPYAGPPITGSITDRKAFTYPVQNITLTTGIRTAEQIAADINYQVGQQSVVTGMISGTAIWTTGSPVVTGVITEFADELMPGDWIKPSSTSVWYQVAYIPDDLILVLTTPYAAATLTDTIDETNPQIILALGLPYGSLKGFVRLLANIPLEVISKVKGAIELDPVADDAYTVLSFNTLYSKSGSCYMLYNPGPSSTVSILTLSGDITFTTGSNSVTGVGSLFTIEVKAGDLIKFSADADQYYAYVTEVLSNTNLILDGNYLGAGGTSDITRGIRSVYNTRLSGQVFFTNGNNSVTGTSTLFLTELAAGDMIRLPGDSVWGEVATIIDNFNLQLTGAYLGTTGGSATGTTRKVRPSTYSLGSFRVQPDLLLAQIGV